MPSVAQQTPPLPSSKKRRRDDGEHIAISSGTNAPITLLGGDFTKSAISMADHLACTSPSQQHQQQSKTSILHHHFHHHHHHHHQHTSPAVRKIVPLPVTKRQRLSGDEDRDMGGQRHAASSPQRHHQQQPKLQSQERAASNSSSRCHICFRKPSKKSDLDSFADCQGCGQRTCYICIRQCLGWREGGVGGTREGEEEEGEEGRLTESPPTSEASFTMLDADEAPPQERHQRPHESDGWAKGGHRPMVCSRCCVERGPDGDVVCLGCLSFIEG